MNSSSILDLLNTLPLHIYWKDKYGAYLGCNLEQARAYGYEDASHVIGKTDLQLAEEESIAQAWMANDQQVIQSGQPLIIEETNFIHGHEVVQLSCKSPFKDAAGNVAGIIGVSIDITGNKLIQQQLLAEKKQVEIALDNIIAHIPGHIYWLDNHNRYLGCNDLHAQNAGLSNRREIIGKTNEELSWGNQADFLNAINDKVRQTKIEYCQEETGVMFNGDVCTFLSRKKPLFDENRNVIGVLGASLDITERKRIEQALVVAKQEAEAASKAKSDFLANMSHDVKTPLSGMISVVELLAPRLGPENKKLLEDVGQSAKKLMSFFENCIELSKMDMAELQNVEHVFSMHNITQSIYELFLPSAIAKHLQFVVDQEENVPTSLIGSQTNIYRILLNLVGNAIKFTQQGKVEILVRVHEKIDKDKIIIKLSVKDTGIGIPKDKQKIIFEKLQRLAPSYYNKQEGHGIGLYVVDQYVKAMHASIEVESELGEGSTFTVTMPLRIANDSTAEIVMPPRLTEKEVPAAATYKPFPAFISDLQLSEDAPHVLLVEDNPMIQAITGEIIRAAGAKVDVASTGAEAVALYTPDKYIVIYMDIGLPDMDGYAASHAIRDIERDKKAKQTPIIAVSAHAPTDISSLCAEAEMQGVLSKPLHIQQARQIIAHYRDHNSEEIDGLYELKSMHTQTIDSSIIDLTESAKLMGSELRAKDLLFMTADLLDKTLLSDIAEAYHKKDQEALQKIIHQLLGSLCYVSAPSLKKAVLNFQQAMKEDHTAQAIAYEAFLSQISIFKKAIKQIKVS